MLVATALSSTWTSQRDQALGTLAAKGPLRTAVFDGETFDGASAAEALRRTRAAGAVAVRLTVD
ncbi:MAG: hypothetical protein ACRDLR_01385, partial [Gaiellaceae bacterium]